MSEGEFSLIDQYFRHPAELSPASAVGNQLLGIGDDASVMQLPADRLLVQTMDTLIEGRHFPASTSAADIAYKCLAVNVSDLVAMAATPWTFLLSLTVPNKDHEFLSSFSESLFCAADDFGISLIGGDTCKGTLSITIQANGHVGRNEYVTRGGARVGDYIMVSGHLGAAALGLAGLQGRCHLHADDQAACLQMLNRPRPRTDLIQLLGRYARSAIDVSDGLVSDLGHILQQSGVGAKLDKQALPVYQWIRDNDQYQYALSGGDEYQIVFTINAMDYASVMKKISAQGLDITPIGRITEQTDFILNEGAASIDLNQYMGFNHFAE